MDFDTLFETYYTLYRTEADVPESTEDEYTVAMRLFNEAVNRWEHYENTKWQALYTSLSLEDEPTTLASGQTDYDVPDNFREPGGHIMFYDADGTYRFRYPIVEPAEVQFQNESAHYCYFTGNPSDGFTLHINPQPDSSMDGWTINYVYYKTATRFTTGTDISEMGDAFFCVHRALANRFRGSRNPFVNDAKNDAEDILKTMLLNNIAGTEANPISLKDHSGSMFGD